MGALKEYFLNFIEEAVLNPDYSDYIAGRVEIFDEPSETGYDIDEYRFLVHRDKWREFWDFRDEWDFKVIDENKLKWFKEFVESNYYDEV